MEIASNELTWTVSMHDSLNIFQVPNFHETAQLFDDKFVQTKMRLKEGTKIPSYLLQRNITRFLIADYLQAYCRNAGKL